MTRIEALREMTVEQMAALIDDVPGLTEVGFCRSDCGEEDCNHAKQCIVRWLSEEVSNENR